MTEDRRYMTIFLQIMVFYFVLSVKSIVLAYWNWFLISLTPYLSIRIFVFRPFFSKFSLSFLHFPSSLPCQGHRVFTHDGLSATLASHPQVEVVSTEKKLEIIFQPVRPSSKFIFAVDGLWEKISKKRFYWEAQILSIVVVIFTQRVRFSWFIG